jgi:hypothetical protein
MRYLILENNIVVNAITSTPEFIAESGMNAIQTDKGDIGDVYDGSVFTKPESKPVEFSPVKPMYMRLALLEFGMLSVIESAISQPGSEVHKIAFEYALEFTRDDAMINGFALALGIPSESIDNLFKRGMELQASG